jgi:hypothetical protein
MIAALSADPVLDAFTGGVEVGIAVGLCSIATLAVLATIRRMLSV